MNWTPEQPIGRVVVAFTRAIRAMGYYDAQHPVFKTAEKEAYEALERVWAEHPVITLGCAGNQLVLDGGVALTDEPSAALAERMFHASVVALRLDVSARRRDLAALMAILAEAAERVRDAGGVGALLAAEGVRGISAMEVDFAALFAGTAPDLAAWAGGDPVAEAALRGVLRFREGASNTEALEVKLRQVGSPESLGDFLDELLDEAAPSAREGGKGALEADELADLAAKAYLAPAVADPGHLAESADLLSRALVRLAPEARFALLRRLAGGDETAADSHEDAVGALASRLEEGVVVGAIAAALFEQDDSETVRAIGNVIRRLRPVEAERQRLLQAVDTQLGSRGKPIDGVLWQQLQARALESPGLGMLRISYEALKAPMRQAARARMRGLGTPIAGQEVLYSVDSKITETWASQTLVAVLESGHAGATTIEAAMSLFRTLDQDGVKDEAWSLLRALLAEQERSPRPELEQPLEAFLTGERGHHWAPRLMQQGAPSLLLGQLLLVACERTVDRATQRTLQERLASYPAELLLALAQKLVAVEEPGRPQHLARAAFRADPKLGVRVVRALLRNPNPRVKELVVRGLAEQNHSEAIGLTAHLAGWKGDKYVQQLLHLQSPDGKVMHRVQLAAVSVLGLTRAVIAVRPLAELLIAAPELFGGTEQEILRLAVAQALLTNGTPEAQQVLKEGLSSKKKYVREVCERVWREPDGRGRR